MAAGDTITQSLADSLDTVVASARQVREYEGVMPNLVDKVTLSEGTGTSWREISMAALSAQNITETTTLDNPQQMSDTVFSITPTVTGIQTLVTDRVASRINSQSYAQLGSLAQQASSIGWHSLQYNHEHNCVHSCQPCLSSIFLFSMPLVSFL